MVHPLGKLPHDFLDDIIETSVSQESGELKHGATFPEKLIEPLIKVGSMVVILFLTHFVELELLGRCLYRMEGRVLVMRSIQVLMLSLIHI